MAIFSRRATEEDIKKLNEKNKLSQENLKNVNGGYIHLDNYISVNGEPVSYYEVIHDKTGETLSWGWFFSEDAEETARELGQSTARISDAELEELRRNAK